MTAEQRRVAEGFLGFPKGEMRTSVKFGAWPRATRVTGEHDVTR
jgi:hypothetical protein